ncbi:hypothetical protein [Magnetococcus sp. PR-3]|uniref:hypothetical protein n=1 Tax=Magnetococcus sp. PR-3 TaxID=3120355 RepID=UPI002FCDE83F
MNRNNNLLYSLPRYDAQWQKHWHKTKATDKSLMEQQTSLTADEREKRLDATAEMEQASHRRFRITAHYRDLHFERVLFQLDARSIAFELPNLPNYATTKEINNGLDRAYQTIEITLTKIFQPTPWSLL